MTGRRLDPWKYGCEDVSSLLVLLSQDDVLRMEVEGPGKAGAQQAPHTFKSVIRGHTGDQNLVSL
jgi:hypothetical protein